MHCYWEYKLVQPLWKPEWRFLKKLKIELPYDPAIALWNTLSKGDEITILKRYLHSHAYCSIIHNSQDIEANCVVVYIDIKWSITQP